jgi:hypothetical protein
METTLKPFEKTSLTNNLFDILIPLFLIIGVLEGKSCKIF